MSNLFIELRAAGPVLTDGAWGTQLQARGLPIGGCPDSWNLEHPEYVEEVARNYVGAGSRVILTNTFGGTRIALERHGLVEHTAWLNRAGAWISHHAARKHAKVFASMGPTGKMLAMGEITPDEARAVFEEQAHALADGEADAIVVETMSDLEEAKIAVQAACTTGLPVVASMVFDAGKAGDRTMMGNTPEQCAEELAAAGALAIGTNCGKGADQMLEICRRLRAATKLPLWVKPNAGLPELENGRAVYRTTPDEFADAAMRLVEAGADFIGGCCGTSPAYIAALAARLQSYSYS